MLTISWKPDKASHIPIHKQIVNYVSNKISIGDWIIGDKLPSQRALATLFDVNRSTIVSALEELKAQGLIEGNHGQGTCIVNNTWSLLLSTQPLDWRDYVESGTHKANLPIIQTLNKMNYGKEMTRLSIGELSPELFPHDMITKVFNRLPGRISSLNYLEPLGLPDLRQSLSQYLKKYGIDIPPSCILIVSGILQSLHLISISMLKPGSKVYVEIPSYLKSLHVFQSAGMKLEGVPMDDSGIMPWLIKKDNVLNNTELLYTIPTFHNPTGKVMTNERRAALLEWCKNSRIPIFEDDTYRELWIDEMPPLPLKSRTTEGMVLYSGSVTKSLAPGLRLGWIAGPEAVIERLGDIKMQVDYGSSSVSQWVLTEFIQSGLYDEYLCFLRKQLKIRRDTALNVFESCYKDIATWETPKGGIYIWLKLDNKISTEQLFYKALNEKLLINPGSLYDFSKNQYIRISYAYASLDDLDKGLRRLSELIRSM